MKLNLHRTYTTFICSQMDIVEKRLSKFDIRTGKLFIDFLLQCIPIQELEVEGIEIDTVTSKDIIRHLWNNQSTFWAQMESFPNYLTTMSIVSTWLKNLKNPTQILSVGCGLGLYESFLQQTAFPETNFLCTDIAEGMIAEAKKYKTITDTHFGKTSHMQFQVARAEKLSFGNKTMDAVICTKVLQWSNKKTDVLNEVVRVLKPKGLGLFIFSEGKTAVIINGESLIPRNESIDRFEIGAYLDCIGCKVLDHFAIRFPQGFGQAGGEINDFAI